ncbi:MAG TPA: ABC transporter substrate-binding protein [Candidatus Kapabacteria bacterium]|nr:ABC transporter substrate-binding protein [Candidatus Kapabacteria bacterium]
MNNPKEKRGLSRRTFLRAFGLLSGAAVAPLGLGNVSSASAMNALGLGKTRGVLKVGLIVKRGSWTTDSMLSGIGLYMQEIGNQCGGRQVQLIVEDMGGTGSLLRQTKKLVEQDNVDVVIAHANTRAAASVYEYVAERSVVFVEMNAGEAMPSNLASPKTYFRSTLNLWQANAALGGWAANVLGKRAAIQTSFSNSGFDFHSAFEAGFVQGGGEIVSRVVTGAPTSNDHPMSVLSDVNRLNPSVVFASYSDQAAIAYQHAFQSSGITAPLLGTDFALGLNGAKGGADDVTHASSWSPKLSNAENQAFTASYRSYAGKEADAYAVLGYDTARFVLGAADRSGRLGSLAQAMLDTTFNGPRGVCTCDKASRTLSSPLYLCSPDTEVVSLDPALGEAAYASLDPNDLRGGWLNAYLAA